MYLDRSYRGLEASVVDLADRRRRRLFAIPDEVWDACDAAARAWQEMSDDGVEVRFEPRRDDGRVVAELHESQGASIRRLPLAEVIHIGAPPPEAA